MNILAILFTVTLCSPPVIDRPVSVLGPDVEPAPKTETMSETWGPIVLIAAGVGLVLGGLVGSATQTGCRTRDADFRCVDPRVGTVLMPSMVVLGLAFTITGHHWRRATEPRTP
jgi:hypothetical protein